MKSFLARLFNLTIVNGGLVTGQCSYGFPPFAFPTTRQPAFTTPQISTVVHFEQRCGPSLQVCALTVLKSHKQRWSMEARSQFQSPQTLAGIPRRRHHYRLTPVSQADKNDLPSGVLIHCLQTQIDRVLNLPYNFELWVWQKKVDIGVHYFCENKTSVQINLVSRPHHCTPFWATFSI